MPATPTTTARKTALALMLNAHSLLHHASTLIRDAEERDRNHTSHPNHISKIMEDIYRLNLAMRRTDGAPLWLEDDTDQPPPREPHIV